MAEEQRRQRVEHHQIQRFLAMQRFEASDQREPLGVGRTRPLEGTAQELNVRPQREPAAAAVPVGRRFFGDHDSPARRNRQACELAALCDAGQQMRCERRLARFGRANYNLAPPIQALALVQPHASCRESVEALSA